MKTNSRIDHRKRRLERIVDRLLTAVDRSIAAAEDAREAKRELQRLASEPELRVVTGEAPS